jgi:hypothetical protein
VPTVIVMRETLDGSCVETHRPRMRERMAARLQGTSLDRQLAAGGSPDASVRLALRARFLVRRSTREVLATRLGEVIREAEGGPALITARLPVCRRKVLLARPQLQALARRLLVAGPVAPEGVALTSRLVYDGLGPLYARPDADDLAVAAAVACHALEPWSAEPGDVDDW